ncbi:GtrA family protein [Heyndrickxia faecalis]|uniref:GtrA family protein n=1 Tax=Heyndrickxia faecalis TaxID=2824910 RepID=UPI003D1D84A4
MLKQYAAFLKFCIVGAGNTLIDFLVFFLLTSFHVPYLVAQACSYTAGMANSYLLNRFWTFQVRKKATWGEASRFIAVNLIVYALTSLLLFLFHQQWGWPLLYAKIIATLAGMAVNFLGTRLWVFREHAE